MEFLKDLWKYLRERKKIWLIPLIVIILLELFQHFTGTSYFFGITKVIRLSPVIIRTLFKKV